jgi:protocatechuate 3,4-dioxygenase alpha subunit
MASRLPYLKETPSQTAGPYVHIGLAPAVAGLRLNGPQPGAEIAGPEVSGRRVRIEGRVFDSDGAPVRDAVIEVWQADAQGRYPHPDDPRGSEVEPGFRGWGRVVPDLATGRFTIETIKPGPVPGRGGAVQAPHLTLWLVARGINIGLHTRLYFGDEEQANAICPVLARIEPHRRGTLVAAREQAGPPPVYRFDIHLAGPAETVFFDI